MGRSTAGDPGTNSSAAVKTNTVLFSLWYWGTDRAERKKKRRQKKKRNMDFIKAVQFCLVSVFSMLKLCVTAVLHVLVHHKTLF